LVKELLIVQFFIFFLPSMIFAYLADPRPLNYAGLKAPQKKSFFLIALITIIVAYLTVEFLGMINEAAVHLLPANAQKWVVSGEEDANGPLGNILSMKTPVDLMVTIFFVGLLPAIGEELFFRGILQKLFILIFKKAWPGIIFTGFLFSAIHMQFMGFLPRMALGIILGSLYWYSGSLYASMLGHFVFNAINILFIYGKMADLNSKTSYSLGFTAIGIVSLAGVIFLINYLRKKSTTSYAIEFPPYRDNAPMEDSDQPR
jgi:membrane protease YdiL (CAAX protease family)